MEKEPIFTRGFIFCFIATFFNSMIFYMLISISAEYAREFGAGGSLQGLASGIYVLGMLLTRFLFSRILAVIGWKKMICIFQPLHIASCFFYFLICDMPTFLIVRLVHGLFFGLASSSILTAGTYHLAKSRYGEANGYMMTGITLAIAVGPFAAGLIYDTFGPNGCFVSAVAIAAGMWICLLLSRTDYDSLLAQDMAENKTFIKEKPHGLNSMIEVSALPITVCTFISAFSYSTILSFIRTYGQVLNLAGTVSLFFVVYAAVLLVSRPAAGRIQDRKGDSVIIYPCIIMQFFSLFLLWVSPNPFGIIFSAVLCAAGYGSATSCFNTITTRGLPAERKSYAVNTYWIGCDLANGLGPVVLGAVMEASGVRNMYLIAAVTSVFTLVFYRFLYQRFAAKRAGMTA